MSSFTYRLIFGQLLSLSTTVSSVCSQLALDKSGISLTAVPSIFVYFTLMIWHWRIRLTESYRHLPVLWYVLAALSDVSATYLIFLAFFFAPIAQISLLEDAAIPISFAIDFFWFKRVRKMGHLVGALLCTASIIFYSLMAGGLTPTTVEPWRVVLGIVLPLLSATCYSVSNALQVYLVELYDRDIYMYFLGLFGTLFSIIFSIPLLRAEIYGLISSWQIVLLTLSIVIALLFFYISLPHFLVSATPTFFNMSLMTKNFYILLASEVLIGRSVPWYGWVAFTCIAVSLIIFSWEGKCTTKESVHQHNYSIEK